jgi:hypothetical protein
MPEHQSVRDVHARTIVYIAIVLALTIAAVCGIAYGLLDWWHRPFGGPNAPLDFRIAPPLLESAPLAVRAQFEREKETRLHGYGWVDRSRGIAHIPIDEAMQRLAQQNGRQP